jgi:hypothetical protein
MEFKAYSLVENPEWSVIKVKALETESDLHIPVHVICVIDTSYSMDTHSKLNNVKKSIYYLLDYLGPKDLITIITFSNDAECILDKEFVTTEQKEKIRTELSHIATSGNTNLSAGLDMARNKLLFKESDNQYKQGIILLTDGNANMGLIDKDSILEIVDKTMNTQLGTSVSCIGYGFDHNQKLLQNISKHGGGSYDIVKDITSVAEVFGNILGGFITCRFQNTRVFFPRDTRIKTHYKVQSISAGEEVTIGDMPIGSEAVILAEIPADTMILLRANDIVMGTDINLNTYSIYTLEHTMQNNINAHYHKYNVIDIVEKTRKLLLSNTAKLSEIKSHINYIDGYMWVLKDTYIDGYKELYNYNPDPLWDILIEELHVCKTSLLSNNRAVQIESANVMNQHTAYLGTMRGIATNYNENISLTPITPRIFSNSIQREISSQLTSILSPIAATRTLESKYYEESDDDTMTGILVSTYDNDSQMTDPYSLPNITNTSNI